MTSTPLLLAASCTPTPRPQLYNIIGIMIMIMQPSISDCYEVQIINRELVTASKDKYVYCHKILINDHEKFPAKVKFMM